MMARTTWRRVERWMGLGATVVALGWIVPLLIACVHLARHPHGHGLELAGAGPAHGHSHGPGHGGPAHGHAHRSSHGDRLHGSGAVDHDPGREAGPLRGEGDDHGRHPVDDHFVSLDPAVPPSGSVAVPGCRLASGKTEWTEPTALASRSADGDGLEPRPPPTRHAAPPRAPPVVL